jgi:acetylornithine/N-succinyldiaminopimelate aminotransferase
MATISASNQDQDAQGLHAAAAEGFKYVDFDDLEGAKAADRAEHGGLLVEPIQGEGGIRPASPEFMQGLRALCDEHDLMLVLDEVQCGVARTGTLYAYEHYGITPDIMATAKGIGGGFPLGACLATEKAARGMDLRHPRIDLWRQPAGHGGRRWPCSMPWRTTNSSPRCAREKGERLRARLEQFIGNYPDLFELVRGKGLMLGLKMKIESRAVSWRTCATIISC